MKHLTLISSLFLFMAGRGSTRHSDNWFKLKAEDFQTTLSGKQTNLYILKNSNSLEDPAFSGFTQSTGFPVDCIESRGSLFNKDNL